MTPPRGLEALLLLLVSLALLLGGGLGCEPTLEGVRPRLASVGVNSSTNHYFGLYGQRSPGNAWYPLEYPIVPTASIEARVGVFNDRYLQASVGAEGCVGLRQDNLASDWRICATYEVNPANLHIFSTLGGETADCAGATRALLRLEDDGINVSARYTCPSGSPTLLKSVASEWDVGEKWFLTFGAYNLAKGAEVGFDDFHYVSDGPFEASLDGNIAFATFDAFRFGIDAYHLFEADDFGGGASQASIAGGALAFATTQTRNAGAFPDTDVLKDLSKADKSYAKTFEKLFPDRFGGYFKSFPKVAEGEACAMQGMVPFF